MRRSQWGRRKVSRRTFLALGVAGVSGAVAAVLGIPLLGSLLSPVFRKREAETDWMELGELKDFPEGEPRMVTWPVVRKDGWVMETAERAAWVYRRGAEDVVAYNPRCTHLGCAYFYNSKAGVFNCPCHDGVFGLDGEVLGGPPPRPLDTLEVKVEGNKVYTIYRDFKLGVSSKAEV